MAFSQRYFVEKTLDTMNAFVSMVRKAVVSHTIRYHGRKDRSRFTGNEDRDETAHLCTGECHEGSIHAFADSPRGNGREGKGERLDHPGDRRLFVVLHEPMLRGRRLAGIIPQG